MFLRFKDGKMYVTMKKHMTNNYLASGWEGLFLFVKYLDGNQGYVEHDESERICVIKRK